MSAGDLTWLPLLLPVLLLQGIMTTLAQRDTGSIVAITCGTSSDDAFSMYAQVNAMRCDEPHSYSNETAGTIYCSHHDKDNVLKSYIELEIVLEGDPPSNIELHAGPLFLHSLAHSTLNCYYKDIGPGHRIENITSADLQPSSLSEHYFCIGIEDFYIILQEVPKKTLVGSSISKRSAVQPLERKCARFSGVHDGKEYSLLGQLCNATDGGPGIRMFNEEGEPDCLPCCAGYHWAVKPIQQCQKCRPCTARPEPNVFKSCTWIGCAATPTDKSTTEHTPTSTETPGTTPPDAFVQIKPPTMAPTELQLVIKTPYYAIIKWNEVPSTKLKPVEKYVVKLIDLKLEESKEFRTEGVETWMNLTNLSPRSTYRVMVCASNTAGIGDSSGLLEVNTTRNPPALTDVNVTVDQRYIVVTWKPQPNSEDLNVAVVYRRDEELASKAVRISMETPGNEIRFIPSNGTSYQIQAFYFNTEGDGRLKIHKNITIEYESGTPLEITYRVENSWWGISLMAVFPLLSIIVITTCGWRKMEIFRKWIKEKWTGYTPGRR